MARYPEECPVFWNKLRDHRIAINWPNAHILPEIVVAVDVDSVLEGQIDCVRPDNGDFVIYQPSDLKPLTSTAKAMLAIAKAGEQ